MTDAGAAVGMDRLPWLDDEPAPHAERRVREPKQIRTGGRTHGLAGWVVAGALLVAGGSYWLGVQSGELADSGRYEAPAAPSEATLTLPEARTIPSVPVTTAPEVSPAPVPTVTVPTVERPVRRENAVTRRRTLKPMDMKDSDLSKTVATQESTAAKGDGAPTSEPPMATSAKPAPSSAAPLASRDQLKLWPSRVSSGASGKLVQIGAFGSRQQAKLGWRRMKRAYPAVGRLPAVVVEARNSRGKRFYRFQIGTTSQAHSEVLCQRMQTIRFSCAVVGLPWKSKVER